jgi:hypothetical protein
MASGLDPSLMTAAERLHEVAALLAAGLRRLRCREQANNLSNSSRLADNSLDSGQQQSVDATVSPTPEIPYGG